MTSIWSRVGSEKVPTIVQNTVQPQKKLGKGANKFKDHDLRTDITIDLITIIDIKITIQDTWAASLQEAIATKDSNWAVQNLGDVNMTTATGVNEARVLVVAAGI